MDPDDMSDSEVRADIERENGGLDGVQQGRHGKRGKRAFLNRLVRGPSCMQSWPVCEKPTRKTSLHRQTPKRNQ